MKIIFAFLIMTATSMAATLNVPGQYPTVQAAVTAAQPGDTVLIAAGNYTEDITTARAGTSDSRIVIDGQGVATIRKMRINHPYITFKRTNVMGPSTGNQYLVTIGLNADFALVQDLVVDCNYTAALGGIGWASNVYDIEQEATDTIVERCEVRKCFAYPMLGIVGQRHIIRNCRVHDGRAIDFVRLFGANNLIQDNVFENSVEWLGAGYHPDFIQTFGNAGSQSYGHILERNIVNNVHGQVFQLSATGQPNVRDWIIRNNIFANVTLGGGGSMPGVKIYNNVFYKVGSSLSFGVRVYGAGTGITSEFPIYSEMLAPTPSGSLVAEGDGGIYRYGGYYQVRANTIASGNIEAGRQYSVRSRGTAAIEYNGVNYTNAQVFTGVEGVTTYTKIAPTLWEMESLFVYAHGTFTYKGVNYARDAWFQTDPAVRTYTSTWPEALSAWRVVVDVSHRTEIKNNVFLDVGAPGSWSAFYGIDERSSDVSADYNYVGKDGFQAVLVRSPQNPVGSPLGWGGKGWYEPNGINGGNPGFTDPSNLDFRLQPGSILIDQGVVIAGVTSDFANTIRPLGAAPDIGAFEYDDGSPPPDPPAPGTPPDAPSNLSATAGSSSTILLEWTDNADDEAYFELDRSLNNSTWTTTNQIDANTTAHVVTGLNASTLYYFRLRAVNGDGNSAYAATVSATTQAPPVVGTPPAAPSNFQTTAIGAHSIAMAWDDNSADETGFQIDCSPDGVAWSTIANLAANMESWTNSGLAPSTTYYYRVRAVNNFGNSAWSNDDATTTAASPPSRPARAQSARGDLIGQ